MTPSGLVMWQILFAILIVSFVKCTPNHSVTCPTDWSIDPVRPTAGRPDMVHCWAPGAKSASKCNPSSCSGYPVCNSCKDNATGQIFSTATCYREFHAWDGSTLPSGEQAMTVCVDEQNRTLQCSGVCQGALTCSDCVTDTPSGAPKALLRRRANPFSAGMSSNNGHADGNYFGDSFNL